MPAVSFKSEADTADTDSTSMNSKIKINLKSFKLKTSI